MLISALVVSVSIVALLSNPAHGANFWMRRLNNIGHVDETLIVCHHAARQFLGSKTRAKVKLACAATLSTPLRQIVAVYIKDL